MKLAYATATLALFASSAAAQATIIREVVTHASMEDTVSLAAPRVIGAGAQTLLFDTSLVSADGGATAWNGLQLPGVELVAVRGDSVFEASCSFELLATDPNGTLFSAFSLFARGVYGETESWGGLSFTDGQFMNYSNGTPLPPGGTDSHSVNFQDTNTFTHEVGDGVWQWVLALPNLVGFISWDVPPFTVTQADGVTPTTGVVTSASGRAYYELTFTRSVELAEVQVVPTCTSQPNSTGQNGSLRAYGSLRGGNAWLTVRSSDLPPQQGCLLFMGTAPAFQAFPTYNLCLGGSLTREGGVQITDVNGEADHEIDLGPYLPGTVLYAQVVHRDPSLLIGATDAVALVVE